MLYVVILCGGSGSRLWPMSRAAYPKQFLKLVSQELSMIQETVERVQNLDNIGGIIAVCGEDYRFVVAEQLNEVCRVPLTIVLEPEPKNTAPAVALGALTALEKDENAELLVLPSDHIISDIGAFEKAFGKAISLAKRDKLVTFGVTPAHAETGYGYIEKGLAIDSKNDEAGYEIARFTEKPDRELAEDYLQGGKHLWNSGMFIFSAEIYLEELTHQAPLMSEAARKAYEGAAVDLDFLRVNGEQFSKCPSDSIDYAVMENTKQGAVVELDAGWSDIGSWEGLASVSSADHEGNVIRGDVVIDDSSGCYIHSTSRLVAATGVNNVVVVETPDAVLVADKSESQKVKDIVSQLKARKRQEAHMNKLAYRPWGSYETICMADRFQVKQIIVKPGEKLSMQKHFHRAEHWIVVKGTALVTKDDEKLMLNEDESTYIPIGCKHRLENPGKIMLELIEVQSGSYLGEDDIVRYDDVYGRSGEN